jgi:pseudouridine synthase
VPIGDIQLHPVGRLDLESEGLVILTNDGHLTDLLTHPRYQVEKEYLVGVDAAPTARDLERMVRGVEVDGERLRAASAQVVEPPPDAEPGDGVGAWLLVTLRQGKNREIRRMLAALGRQVVVLRRLRVGPLRLGTLGSGAFRELTAEEVAALYRAGRAAAAAADRPEPRGRLPSRR